MEKFNFSLKTLAVVLTLGSAMTMVSCSSEKEVVDYGSIEVCDVSNADCFDPSEKMEDGKFPKTELRLTLGDGGVVDARLNNFLVNCDFGFISVDKMAGENELMLVAYEHGIAANCMCMTDVSFKLRNVAEGTCRLRVFRGNTTGTPIGNEAAFEGEVTLRKGHAAVVTFDL